MVLLKIYVTKSKFEKYNTEPHKKSYLIKYLGSY